MKNLIHSILPITLVCSFLISPLYASPPEPSPEENSAASHEPLVIGVFPRRDPVVTMRLFTPLHDYLEKELGRKVVLETAANFEKFEQRLKERRYDLVHINQYQYVKAHDQLAYVAIAQNEEFNEASISGAIYVRSDSGYTRLEQLRGKHILFGGGEHAMMSYIVPSYLLRRAGLKRSDYHEHFANSPPNAVLATYLSQIDAGGAGEVVRRLPIITSKIDTSKLRLLSVSEPLPHLPWAVKQEMPITLKNHLQRLLTGLKESIDGRAVLKAARLTGLNIANNADYDPHRKIISTMERDDTGEERSDSSVIPHRQP